MPAGDVEGQHDIVTHLDLVDAVTDLDDLTQVLVAEPAPGLEVGPALVHVQIGPADVRRGDAHEHIRGALDARVGDVLHADRAGALVNDSFHFLAFQRQ